MYCWTLQKEGREGVGGSAAPGGAIPAAATRRSSTHCLTSRSEMAEGNQSISRSSPLTRFRPLPEWLALSCKCGKADSMISSLIYITARLVMSADNDCQLALSQLFLALEEPCWLGVGSTSLSWYLNVHAPTILCAADICNGEFVTCQTCAPVSCCGQT